MARTPREELVHLLSDLYSMELQALAQLTSAPGIVRDQELAAHFRLHHAETEQQAETVRARLEALGGSHSTIKNAVMRLGGKGFLLFARLQTETPGRLVAHAYSYEAMEWAGYGILMHVAEQTDDATTLEIGRSIQAQEREMMRRIERGFDAAEAVSHRDTSPRDLPDHVRKHLTEIHAIESQSIKLLEKGVSLANKRGLGSIYARHLDETRAQIQSIEQRLQSLGANRSTLEDALLKLGGMSWGAFFQAQSDTLAKLAAFTYAVEHLEMGGYELLRRVARRAGDLESDTLCQRLLAEERSMADRLADSFGLFVQATLS